MKAVIKILSASLVIAVFASCQTVEYKIAGQASANPQQGLNQNYASLGLGIVELSKPQPPQCSEKGVATVQVKMTAVDSIIHFFTGGIYTSRHITVQCVD